ncbi:MAG: hypothetical protein WBG44_11270 [Comamonas sp.]
MRIAVAIPCYRVTRHVLRVIEAIGPRVETIYAVDDACPEGSGRFIEAHCREARVRVLYHLGIIRAVVHDVPMDAVYAGERSNLRVSRVLPTFLGKHLTRMAKRYFYLYLLRDFNIGSLYSIAGGLVFGGVHWARGMTTGEPTSSGTVMLAALPLIIGIQFLIAFLHYDVSNVPNEVLSAAVADEA